MKKKIFTGILSSCLIILGVCIIFITGFLYNYYSDKQVEGLETELVYLTHIIEEHGTDDVQFLSTNDQVTLIDKNGKRVKSSGENFKPIAASSELVITARANGTGKDHSYRTILEKQVDISKALSDGSVVCISDIQFTAISLMINMIWYVVAVLAVAVLMSLLLSKILSNRILRPVYDLDLLHPDKKKVYPELEPFVDKVTEQNQKIAQHMEKLEEKHHEQDKMRREFTANVSHELKTPLTSISGYAEIIRDGLASDEVIPRFAGKIYDESKRMINLVGDIIKLSQLDENEINVRIERINLYECCEAVLSNLEPQAKKNNITVTLEGDHAEISGAEVIIEEIVHNICDNAIKYNKYGGNVNVTIRQCIDGVEMTVKDTGIGISEEDLPHVFERFYRADKSHSKEIGGTGLGLSIVKHGTMFHNASLSIESKIGVGTTVRLLF